MMTEYIGTAVKCRFEMYFRNCLKLLSFQWATMHIGHLDTVANGHCQYHWNSEDPGEDNDDCKDLFWVRTRLLEINFEIL